jgi:hypothetical protein
MSLQEFIRTNHEKLVSMTREKVAKRSQKTRPEAREAKYGVHVFLDQLREALVAEARRDPKQQAQPDPPTNQDIAETAALHGHDLLGLGFSIDEVVHEYGDVCQAVTELAVELHAPVSVCGLSYVESMPGQRHRRRGDRLDPRSGDGRLGDARATRLQRREAETAREGIDHGLRAATRWESGCRGSDRDGS